MKKLKESKGFTLIELLVVIAIIGILATFIMVSVHNARKKAKDKQIMNAISQIANQEADEYDSNNVYTDADGTGATTLDKLVTEITAVNKGGSATAVGSVILLSVGADAFSAHAQLISNTANYFCKDSNGFADTVAVEPATEVCN